MQEVRLNLRISAEEYLKWYQGRARFATARAVDGRSVRFPADILKPFVTRSGIEGAFVISFDAKGKFHSIRRL